MKDFAKTCLAIVGFATAAGLTYAFTRLVSRKVVILPESAVKHIDLLTLADIVNYFKGLDLDKSMDTPFVSKDFEKFNVKTPQTPLADEKVLLVGVYHEQSNTLSNYVVVYSHSYDDALKSLLAKAEDGVVTLS